MSDFPRLCPLQTPPWQPGIPDSGILEFWNSHYIDYADYVDYLDYVDYTDYTDYTDLVTT